MTRSLTLLLLIALLSAGVAQALGSSSRTFVIDGEPVPPGTIRVTTLGSGSPDVRRHQVASGFLIELGNGDKFIFDLGTGSYVNLVATGVPQAQLTKVFLSHLHSDHMADLASLYVGAMFGRTTPWEVWGPSGPKPELGTAAIIDGLRRFLAWDTYARRKIDFVGREDKGDEVIAHEFNASKVNNRIYDRNGVRVTSTPVPHYETVGPVALRLDWAGLSVVYSGDMRPNPAFEELASGADLVLLQNMGPILNGNVSALPYSSQYLINTSHVTPEQSGPIFSRIKPRLGVLHHLVVNDASREAIITAVRAGYPEGEIHINEDLDVYEVSAEGVKRRRWLVPERSWGYWHAESNHGWQANGAHERPQLSGEAGAGQWQHNAASSRRFMQ